MIRVFTSETQKTGQLGEDLAVRYLREKGFSIISRNYTVKQGEIDIVAKKGATIYFFEIKSIFRKSNVSHETYNPAENMHPKKLERFFRSTECYCSENNVSCETCIKLLCVYIEKENKKAYFEIIDI